MRFFIARGPWLALGAALLSSSLPARADTKSDCAKAYEASQEQRSQDKLRDAHKNMLTCSQSACPGFIKKDCAKWLAEVEAAMPTVVFSAKAGGQDVSDVRVRMGDEVLTESLDGKAIDMDPGPHTFVFESDKYGRAEAKVVVKEGKKAQSVDVSFQSEDSGDGSSNASSGGPTEGKKDQGVAVSSESGSGRKTIGYVLLGVGAVGIGGFAYFGLTGKSDQNKLACADTKTCTDADLDPIKKKYLFADISLGVGVVAAALGTYFLVSAPSSQPAPAEDARRLRFDLGPTRGGGFASVAGAF